MFNRFVIAINRLSALAARPAEPTITPTPDGECVPPPGWREYIVQRGNTLFTIATATGTTVGELQQANCIEDADVIFPGQTIYVPPLPSQITPTPVELSPVLGCATGGAQITSPAVGQRVRGAVVVRGTANVEDFGYYTLSIRPDTALSYVTVYDSTVPVIEGVLAEVSLREFDRGIAWLRLNVIDTAGYNAPNATCAIPILIE